MMSSLTAMRLREVVKYDPITGEFTWMIGGSGRRSAIGERAGGPTERGYWRIVIDRQRYKAHRLAWLYMTGKWPTSQIDHRDTVRSNNAWSNLREATNMQNHANKCRPANNRSGFKGVCWVAGKQRWLASITKDQKRHHLGYFSSLEAAAAAYEAAASELFGEFARVA